MIKRELKVLVIAVLIISTAVLAGCADELVEQPLMMIWGIDERVSGFEGLEKEPEGVTADYDNANILRVTWEVSESYILPISATSEKELEGVRYLGSGIPQSLEVEWLDPRERQWYALDEIPAEMVKVNIIEESGHYSIDFGPPEGAEFREGMFRVIWFRITPVEPGYLSFNIFGYLPDETEAYPLDPISNVLALEAEVIEE